MKNKSLIINLFFLLAIFVIFSSVLVSAADCWQYATSSTCGGNANCTWQSDTWGGYCNDKSCWDLYSRSDCTTTSLSGKNCSWHSGLLSYSCEEVECWSFYGTNQETCENNTANLSCQWHDFCYTVESYSGIICWNITDEPTCLNSTGCGWGQCWKKTVGVIQMTQ